MVQDFLKVGVNQVLFNNIYSKYLEKSLAHPLPRSNPGPRSIHPAMLISACAGMVVYSALDVFTGTELRTSSHHAKDRASALT